MVTEFCWAVIPLACSMTTRDSSACCSCSLSCSSYRFGLSERHGAPHSLGHRIAQVVQAAHTDDHPHHHGAHVTEHPSVVRAPQVLQRDPGRQIEPLLVCRLPHRSSDRIADEWSDMVLHLSQALLPHIRTGPVVEHDRVEVLHHGRVTNRHRPVLTGSQVDLTKYPLSRSEPPQVKARHRVVPPLSLLPLGHKGTLLDTTDTASSVRASQRCRLIAANAG